MWEQLIFTVVQIVLLYLGGMNLFDSCVHSFGSMGTGGFSDYNLSIGHFHNAYIDTIIIIFMLLSGASFNLHFKAIKYGPKVYTKDIELRTYLFYIPDSITHHNDRSESLRHIQLPY